jgi:D-alanyl-lipoteichoic acid acyltransferase DltB (MBOAT superfamily)
MKRVQPFLALAVLLAVSSGVVYGSVLLLLRSIRALAGFESEFAAALVAISGTVLIGIVTLVFTQRESKRRDIREAHRVQKVAIYKRFMDTAIVDMLKRTAGGKELSNDEVVQLYQEFFITFTADMIIWGSPNVIQAFRRFRIGTASQPQSAQTVLILMDELLREIRKDLGNSNWQIAPGDLFSAFLKDPNDIKTLLANK